MASEQKPLAAGQKSMRGLRKDIFQEELGYKDESNPFGDHSLTSKFVWKKKNEYLSAAGLYRKTGKEEQFEKAKAKIREIHTVKKRRDEREVEKQLLEKQRLEHDAERHDDEYDDWLKKEEGFHLDQAKVRTNVRIDQGRERPIDLVAKGLNIVDGEEYEDMTILDRYPHQLLNNLSLDEVEDMLGDIDNFVRNDTQHKEFWKAMQFVCRDAADQRGREKAKGAKGSHGSVASLGAGIAEGVVQEVHELLSSKSKKELTFMLSEIKEQLLAGGAGVDTQFFEAVSSKIPLFVARAEIEDWHDSAKKKADAWLDDQQTGGNAKDAEESDSDACAAEPDKSGRPAVTEAPGGDWDDLPAGGVLGAADDGGLSPELEPHSVLEEQPRGGSSFSAKGGHSPVLELLNNFDPQDLVDPEEDELMLRKVRRALVDAYREAGEAEDSAMDRRRDDELVQQELGRGYSKDEVGFNAQGKGDNPHGEIELAKQTYEWESKYKPRKPRFFNRVKTGYEWNKYNQTHYDHDNPPPKIVQGYKFNIFYPDLIDKATAPKYFIEHSDTGETVTLRFHAGPPYEDCAFKIVNREWQLSHKFGFRCVFDRGVLQLYFSFKRWRYRR